MSSSAKLAKEMATRGTSIDRRVTTVTIITLKITTPRISMKRNHGQQIVEKEIDWQGINFSFRDLHTNPTRWTIYRPHHSLFR